MAGYRIGAGGEQLVAALVLPGQGPRGHVRPPMREDENEFRVRTEAPQLARDPFRQPPAQVRVRDPGSAFSSGVLARMV
jgi:hypothetical protein